MSMRLRVAKRSPKAYVVPWGKRDTNILFCLYFFVVIFVSYTIIIIIILSWKNELSWSVASVYGILSRNSVAIPFIFLFQLGLTFTNRFVSSFWFFFCILSLAFVVAKSQQFMFGICLLLRCCCLSSKTTI